MDISVLTREETRVSNRRKILGPVFPNKYIEVLQVVKAFKRLERA